MAHLLRSEIMANFTIGSSSFWEEYGLTMRMDSGMNGIYNFLDDGSEGWIQEDDGSFTIFHHRSPLSENRSFSQVPVGQYSDILGNGQPIFVTHKSKAQVNGGEGELPFRIIPGETADFVDGIRDGQVISIELLPDEQSVYLGEIVELEELGLKS